MFIPTFLNSRDDNFYTIFIPTFLNSRGDNFKLSMLFGKQCFYPPFLIAEMTISNSQCCLVNNISYPPFLIAEMTISNSPCCLVNNIIPTFLNSRNDNFKLSMMFGKQYLYPPFLIAEITISNSPCCLVNNIYTHLSQ